MKTNGKRGCLRLVALGAPTCGGRVGADKSRNRKMYENRLTELGLTKPPVAPTVKKPTHKELAQLAVSLAKGVSDRASAGELAGRALEIWKAASSAVLVEEMASYMVKGLCVFNWDDWNRHCRSLVALLDDARGAVPGQSTREQLNESAKRAQVKAGRAVALLWKQEQRGEAVIRALFPGKGETTDTRHKKLLGILEFAKKRVSECSVLDWAENGNRLEDCLRHTWEPLGIPADEVRDNEVTARSWLDMPEFVDVSNLDALPMLARWLSVLRMEQAAESKNRA